MKNEIIPAILTNTKRVLDNKIKKVEGLVKTVQIDIVDGKLFRNKTITVLDLPKSKVDYEIQLMVKEPVRHIEDAKSIGAKIVIFHIESCKNKREIGSLIKKIKRNKMKAGIGLLTKTKAEKIKPFLKDIDQVLIMTHRAGYGGLKFMPLMLKKVALIRKWDPKINIEVDGGVNEKTMIDCLAAGANKLVMGSAIFGSKDAKKTIKKLNAYL